MQKAEPRQGHVQGQTAARQGGGVAVESPQGEQIAQLEAMMDSSLQMEEQGGMAAMMNASPAMAAQRMTIDMIHNSPHVAAQRKMADMMNNSPRQVAQKKSFGGIHNSSAMAAQRKKFESMFVAAQRVENEEPLQGKFVSNSPAQLEQQPAAKPNNTGMPDNLKSGIENLSGMSMDHVKVHYNSSQPAQLNALAYAQGSDIHVAPGQEQHLPHEAWHVVQQAQGRVRPTMQMKDGVPVNDDQGLEREADLMGERAVQMHPGLYDAKPDSAFFGLTQREEVELEEGSAEESPLSGELDAENLKEHGGDEGGPGDDDRIAEKRVGVQLQVNEGSPSKKTIQRMLSNTIQRARGYIRGAATAATLAITESLGSWAMGGLRAFAPVPRNADQTHVVNGTNYTFRNDANGWVEFVNPGHGYGPALAPICTVDIRPWFGAHNKAIKNSIRSTRYNHFMAANEARAADLVGYPNNIIHTNNDYDNGYDNNPDGGSSPAGLTWHHHGLPGKMELINRDVHAAFRHGGGYSAWGS